MVDDQDRRGNHPENFRHHFRSFHSPFDSFFENDFFSGGAGGRGKSYLHLKYYFNKKVCLSICFSVCECVRRLAPIPAGESQDVTNKSCYICLRGDKNALRVISLTPGVPGPPESRMYPRSEYFLVIP